MIYVESSTQSQVEDSGLNNFKQVLWCMNHCMVICSDIIVIIHCQCLYINSTVDNPTEDIKICSGNCVVVEVLSLLILASVPPDLFLSNKLILFGEGSPTLLELWVMIHRRYKNTLG